MRCHSGQRLFIIGASLWLLAAIAVYTVDGPFARYDVNDVPGDLRRLVQHSEVFAHGLGVGMIILTLWVLDRDRRQFVPRVACLAFLPGIVANTCKLLVTRHRPRDFDLEIPASASFVGIPGNIDLSELQSFPSGHTATAVGLALALSSLYPQGRGLFALLAVLAASQRVLFDAHFASDTLAGAGLAFVVAAFLRDRLFWDVGPRVLR
ncbi:MAG: phosphatase PAP2 family protein [Planctomycetes bacterium]|nr:phosphatase PAP2 family protein [Planctomycetota bacterium]